MILQTSYRNIDHSDALTAVVAAEAAKLERVYPRLVSCRVLIEKPHRRRGSPFHVRIELGVPGEDLVISSAPTSQMTVLETETEEEAGRTSKASELEAAHKNGQLAVRDAFRKAERRLREYVRRRSG